MAEILAVVAIVAIAVVLLSVRLLTGREFVKTHIEDNEALREQGIGCAKDEGTYIERKSGLKIAEHSRCRGTGSEGGEKE